MPDFGRVVRDIQRLTAPAGLLPEDSTSLGSLPNEMLGMDAEPRADKAPPKPGKPLQKKIREGEIAIQSASDLHRTAKSSEPTARCPQISTIHATRLCRRPKSRFGVGPLRNICRSTSNHTGSSSYFPSEDRRR